jgi:hypothetical protein
MDGLTMRKWCRLQSGKDLPRFEEEDRQRKILLQPNGKRDSFRRDGADSPGFLFFGGTGGMKLATGIS